MKASKPKRIKRDDHQYDEATRRILEVLGTAPAVLETLSATRAHKISPRLIAEAFCC